MSTQQSCPSPDDLSRLTDPQLPAETLDGILSHLEQCLYPPKHIAIAPVATPATGDVVVWTGFSIIMLLAGVSAMAWLYASRREAEGERAAPATDPLGT